jgi:cell fate (sporulation/competence/biofilm development) regulator YlbF (YheA/YmcA/DUF963 family)
MSEHITTETSVDDQLHEFVDTISDSEPYQQFVESQRQLKSDDEAQELLEEFQQKQQQVQREFDQETMQELRDLKQEMETNETLQEVRQAETAVLELLKETNEIISEQIGQSFARTSRGGCC